MLNLRKTLVITVVIALFVIGCEKVASAPVEISPCEGAQYVEKFRLSNGLARGIEEHLPGKRICSVTPGVDRSHIITWQDKE